MNDTRLLILTALHLTYLSLFRTFILESPQTYNANRVPTMNHDNMVQYCL